MNYKEFIHFEDVYIYNGEKIFFDNSKENKRSKPTAVQHSSLISVSFQKCF